MNNFNHINYRTVEVLLILCMVSICVKSTPYNDLEYWVEPQHKPFPPSHFDIPEAEYTKEVITAANGLAIVRNKFLNMFVKNQYQELYYLQKNTTKNLKSFTENLKLVLDETQPSESALVYSINSSNYTRLFLLIKEGLSNLTQVAEKNIKISTHFALDMILDYSRICHRQVMDLIQNDRDNVARVLATTCCENIKTMADLSITKTIQFADYCSPLIGELANVSIQSVHAITDTIVEQFKECAPKCNSAVGYKNIETLLIADIDNIIHEIQEKIVSLKKCPQNLANVAEIQVIYITQLVGNTLTSVTTITPNPLKYSTSLIPN